jgi:CheY-like chemotaxis protein
MLAEILQSIDPDVDILQASNGSDALDLVDEYDSIDVAFLDFNMPGMDGLELAEALSQKSKVERMALLTANIQNTVRDRAIAQGLSFINKPLNIDAISEFLGSEH